MKKLYSIITKTAIVVSLSLVSLVTLGQNTFSGNVLYHGNPDNPVHSVTITAQNADNTYIQTVVTDENGYFELTNIPYGTITFNAATDLSQGGIELSDAFLVMLHMYNFINLDGYQAIAADVNANGIIDWGDYWNILIDWIMYQLPFASDPWLFDSMEYTFAPSKDGVTVGGNELGATCSGDIGGSYIILDDDKNTPKSTILATETINVLPGEIVDVTFTTTKNLDLAGLYFGIKYDASVVTVIDYATNPSGMEYRTEEIDGMLGFNWMAGKEFKAININKNETFITLTVKIADDADPQAVTFTLDEESAYISANGKSQHTTKLLTQAVNIIEKETATSIEEVINTVSVYPNPATEYIIVEAQNHNNQFIIRDLTGKAVLSTTVSGQKTIDVSSLASGYYLYQMQNPTNDIITGKILISK